MCKVILSLYLFVVFKSVGIRLLLGIFLLFVLLGGYYERIIIFILVVFICFMWFVIIVGFFEL